MAFPPAWFTWQLAEFLEVVSGFDTAESVAHGAAERVAEALDAEVAAILSDGQVLAAVGYPSGEAPLGDLRAVAANESRDLPIPGFGRSPAGRALLDVPQGGQIIVARSGDGAITREELSLLRGMARATSMRLRILLLLDDERAARDDLQQLLDEQAGLRHVAILVAGGKPQNEILAAVAREAGQLSGADFAQVIRYEPDGGAAYLATWGSQPDAIRAERGQAACVRDLSAAVRRAGTRVDIPVHDSTVHDSAATSHGGVGTPIVVNGGLWGVLAMTRSTEAPTGVDRILGFTELAATAISNVQAQREVAASRARAIATVDETRRRIGQQLHEGVQQRLASVALRLRDAQALAPAGSHELGLSLSQAAKELQEVFRELQELARGLHPSILTKGGLTPALRAVSNRSAIPVDLDVNIDRRLPDSVELAAYHIVAEGLANTGQHAHASSVRVAVNLVGESLRVEVRDDGAGGAEEARGSGLLRLRDRVAALGGTIRLLSMPGGGTAIIAEVPANGG
jgi:signal transduction histidine kinase